MEKKISKKKNKVPEFITPCLWSYDIKQVDIKEDKELIITQVLNYGEPKRIKWLYSVYTEEDIKEVLLNPSRGVWFPKVLNFWETVLNIKIPKKDEKFAEDYLKKRGVKKKEIIIGIHAGTAGGNAEQKDLHLRR